jgi:hypothetical protein
MNLLAPGIAETAAPKHGQALIPANYQDFAPALHAVGFEKA